MIEQQMGSLAYFIHQRYPEAIIYNGVNIPEEVPPGLVVYLPLPDATPGRLNHGASQQMLFSAGRIFERDTPAAYAVARDLTTEIQQRRMLIPVVDEAGIESGRRLVLESIFFRAIEDGVAAFDVTWYYRFIDYIEPSEKMAEVHITRRD